MSESSWRLPATELAHAFARGALTPRAHLEALLARIERLDPHVNALVHVSSDAVAAAEESTTRHRQGKASGPLDGIPVAVKDNILVRGMPTTWGSRAFQNAVSEHDELPVARLRAAGAVVIGKTNVPEFTLEGSTTNALFGVTRNPWDLRLTPGGSSGGSVAGVAAGLFPLALGTDGGGSIRRPASHNNVVGFKPSIGAVPRYPSLPQILLDYEVIGPIARSVADAALLYNAIAGMDPLDRSSLAARAAPATLRAPEHPVRMLYVPRIGDSPVDPEIADSVAAAVDVLRGIGHEVVEDELPFDVSPVTAFWPLLSQVGVAHVFARHPGAEALAQPRFVEMAQAGRAVSAERYLAGIEAVRMFRQTVAAAFAHFDLIVMPSAAALPWPAEALYPDTIAGREVGPRGHAVFTGWVNACGHPALALPCAPARNGMPIGFQLVGRYAEDALLFAIGSQYEARAPFAHRWPALVEEER